MISVYACLRFISLGPTTATTARVGPKVVLKGEKISRTVQHTYIKTTVRIRVSLFKHTFVESHLLLTFHQ